MSLYRKFLRYWLTVASLFGFLLGWIFISHSTEAGDTTTTTDGQTLTIEMPTIPSVESVTVPDAGTNSVQTFTFNQNQSGFAPQMRTGGS